MSGELRKALAASLAKCSVATMDPPYTAAFNAALDMVERDVAPFLAITSDGVKEAVASPIDDEITLAFIAGWNATREHASFDMALHYWMLGSVTMIAPPASAGVAHSCPACPVETRDLGAVLHNLIGQLERGGSILDERSARKLATAKASLARWQPIVDAHFAAREKGEIA